MAPQARIEVNGTPGSNDNLPINTLVQLSNQDLGGELSYLWSILDQPTGTVDSLSATNIENPTLTPKKEGTYLLQLIVNFGLPTEQRDRAVVAIRQLKTLERIPAAGETNEDDTMRGWATAVNALYRRVDALLSDPGIIVGANTSGSTLARGDVVRVTSGQVIKSGLPGQETVPGFVKAPATGSGTVDELLCVVEGDVAGNPSVGIGVLTKVRYIGRLASMPLGAGAVGDTIYVSDTATLSTTQGTVRRQVGSIMSVSGGLRDIWFDGVGGADIVPADRAFLLYGPAAAGMLNAHRVDGSNANPGSTIGRPYTFKAGDITTVALAAKRFNVGGADIFQAQDETGAVLSRFNAIGDLDMTGKKIQRAVFQAQNNGTVPLNARRFTSGVTADLFQVQDETGAQLAAFRSTGDLYMLGKKIQEAIFQALNTSTPSLITKRFNAGSTANQIQVQDETGAVLLYVASDGRISMLDPLAAQDAATKNYIDTALPKYQSENRVDNSTFLINQRNPGPAWLALTTTRSVTGADRWGVWQSAAGPICHCVGAAIGLFPAVTAIAYMRFANNGGAPFPVTIWAAQELDRDATVFLVGGKAHTLSFVAYRATGSAPSTITARVVSSNSTYGPANPNYPAGSQVDATQTFTLTTTPTLFTLAVPPMRSALYAVSVQFSVTFTAAVTLSDTVNLQYVMFVEGPQVAPWRPKGGTVDADYFQCQRFFEKSDAYAIPPGSAGGPSPYASVIYGGLINIGQTLPIRHPRFVVPKRTTATVVSSVWTPAGLAGSVNISGLSRAVSVIAYSEKGFILANNAGLAFTPASPWLCQFQWAVDAEY